MLLTTPTLPPLVSDLLMMLAGGGASFLATWFWTRNTRAYTETREQKKAREEVEIKWKEGRLAAEKALHDALIAEGRSRTNDYLKFNADLERVADILQRFVNVQDTITTMAESVRWHGRELARHDEGFRAVHQELNSLRGDITNLYRDGK